MRRPPRTGITFSFVVSQSASAVAMAVNLRRVSPVCVFFLIGTGTGTTAFLVDKGVDKQPKALQKAPRDRAFCKFTTPACFQFQISRGICFPAALRREA
jgi:hypothetical protein